MTQPSLSTFAGNPEGAARSLDVRVVPKAMHRSTPVAVKATARLRFRNTRCSSREER
ncbi:uncharacterized protein LACBIDRAFT_318547 [Laccaria bicolor S238N-H82]|uniref:Predicted protein n=1 Tax=Laccaria bicolor (strain S238N-H82 / ATCC MYA-4686) TaxID=486041 RepID=B0E2M2_LACBS|nr:uncharacterized protein LACBIDRAFT_318547 [Laccaria bicolor S238N-H82]EDQ98902.1 predicted protein [Laccaria bicolor S238N-H82]|eukprot:XP_001890447.1 predicted protein [Laccaria bicolor S238N-H82]